MGEKIVGTWLRKKPLKLNANNIRIKTNKNHWLNNQTKGKYT